MLELVPDPMRDEAVVVLAGPRTVGRSTLLRGLAQVSGGRVIDLDDPATRRLVADDQAFHVGGPGPSSSTSSNTSPPAHDGIGAENEPLLAQPLRPRWTTGAAGRVVEVDSSGRPRPRPRDAGLTWRRLP